MNEDLNFINSFPKSVPGQEQSKQPGIEAIMNPKPILTILTTKLPQSLWIELP